MMWKNDIRTWLAAFAACAMLAGCAGDGSSRSKSHDIVGPSFSQSDKDKDNQDKDEDDDDDEDGRNGYTQIEFLGNPLVSEVTIAKANHDAYNRTQPYNTATFLPQTAAFVTSFGRPAALASLLGSVLYPDMLVVDPSKSPASAGWLSWALANGWGGRKLTDDVVDVGLSAIFSSLLNASGAFCAPFQLPLCTDNVGSNDKSFSAAFPYLATPHN